MRLGCEALVTNYPTGLEWFPPRSNAWVYPNSQTRPNFYYVTNIDYGPIPPAIAALRPMGISFRPPNPLHDPKNKPQVAVVHIRIFGMHSTGGHSIPFYGLEVPCGAGAENYTPHYDVEGVVGMRHLDFRKVADGVFEIY